MLAVKTVEKILRQNDIFFGVLSYRSTPIPDLGASPAELAMEKKLRITMPSLPPTLRPRIISHKEMRKRDEVMKRRQKESYDRRHRMQPLPELSTGDPVLVKTDGEKGWKLPGEVVRKCATRPGTKRSSATESATPETDRSICAQFRRPPSPDIESSLLFRPDGEAGALSCVFRPAAQCAAPVAIFTPGWAAWDTSDRPTTVTALLSGQSYTSSSSTQPSHRSTPVPAPDMVCIIHKRASYQCSPNILIMCCVVP